MAKDLKWAIEEVMKKSKNSLGAIGMGDVDDEDPNKFKFHPVSSHKLVFDSQQVQLEPIYYWILDFMQGVGWKMEKIVDNFQASPGSGQFSEMSMKATKMQEEGMKMLGALNQVVKSVLNLVYDLKEFELRLDSYKDAASEDKEKKAEGILSLKQVWLDNVDLKRGRGSIHQMAAEMGFTTIREAFMVANTQEDLKKMNEDEHGGLINDQVLRILIPRLSDFHKWVEYSNKELTKRFSIEKNYLKSQVETIKLYSGWMKPYFAAAEKLKQEGFDNNAALVNAFSTSMFELQLFGSKGVKPSSKFGRYTPRRGYNQVILIKLEYRGHVSQRVTQKGDYGYGMGGKVDMTFDAYSLNDEELNAAKKLLDDETVGDGLEFSADIAGGALKELKKDLDYFLMSKEEKDKLDKEGEKEGKKKESQDINPFSALFGLGKKKPKKKEEKGEKKDVAPENIVKDNPIEKAMRAEAIEGASGKLYLCYDIYKKSHGMVAPPEPFDDYDAGTVKKLSEGGSVDLKRAMKGWSAD
ncbi:hypothetical protein KAS08_00170 [Candidatus Pacearchaeota archaeon]|nr:hypothetical protein [Candidatus Pacearchaeota archaeon]